MTLSSRVVEVTGMPVRATRALGRSHDWSLYRLDLDGARTAFAKVADTPHGGLFEAEARGLGWLGEAHAAPVPEVLGWSAELLVLGWVDDGLSTPHAAARFGAQLARTHTAGAPFFGADWAGYIGPLPLDNTSAANWPDFYAERRILPYLRRARDSAALSTSDVDLIERVIQRLPDLAGPAEQPARIHGDLWSGNVLWQDTGATVIDPAAHGGHRETDLAMLDLFGFPYLDEVIAGYQGVVPLADGWRERIPLHQLHPLLVHVCLFGGGYRTPTQEAAKAALGA